MSIAYTIKKPFWYILDKNEYILDDQDDASRVRAKFYFDLIETYYYPPSRIEFDVSVQTNFGNKVINLVVFMDGAHTRPFLVAECREHGLQDKLFKYACSISLNNARAIKAKYSVCISGNRINILRVGDGSSLTDVPEWEGGV